MHIHTYAHMYPAAHTRRTSARTRAHIHRHAHMHTHISLGTTHALHAPRATVPLHCAPCIRQARAKRHAQRLMQLSQGGANERREAPREGDGAGGALEALERESYRAEVQRELKAKAREAARAQEQVAVLQRQLAARDAGAAPPTPARGEWAGRSEGELEQALEGASAALSAAQEEADRQEAAAAELERQREELDVELGARQREYEEMEARLRELQAAAMQGQL